MSEHTQVKHARITVTADPTTADRLRALAEAKLGRLISAGVPRADAERIASPHGIGREALASVVESLWDEEIAASEQALSTGAAILPEIGDPPGCSHKQTPSMSASEALILKELAKRPRVPPPEHLAGCQLKACAPGCPVFAAAVASRKAHNADPKVRHGIAIPIDRPPQPDHVHKPVIPSPSDISSLVAGAASALGKLPGER